MSRVKMLLDLVEDVRAVADDLQSIAAAMTGEETSVVVEEITAMPAQEESAEKQVRLEDVRVVLAAKSRAGHTAEVRWLLQKYGASKLSKIDPQNYEALLRDAEGLGNAT